MNTPAPIVPTEEQIRAATVARIQAAQDALQRAQDALGDACSHLSALQWGSPAWKRASKLYDQVHAHWYVVQALHHHRKVRIDPTNIEALGRRLAEKAAKAQAGS